MTAPRDPDRIVGAFLEDGPADLSAHLLQAIRDDVHRTNQRAPRRPWRKPAMPRSLLILVPLGAVLLLAGALALSGGGASEPTPVPASPAASGALVVPTPASQPSSLVVPSPAATSTLPGASPGTLNAGEAWIAFEATDGSVPLVRPDGSGRHVLLGTNDRSQGGPDWSPDGSQIVLQRNLGGSPQLWVMSADGTDGHALTQMDGICISGTPCPSVPQWPRWSPDGRSVAYIASTGPFTTPTSNAVSVVDVATGEIRVLFESSTDALRGLSWSPDSRQLVLGIDTYPSLGTSRTDGVRPTATTIATLDVTSPGAVPLPIPGVPAFAGHPDWSPDGSRIVFRTNPLVNGVRADPGAPSTIESIAPSGGATTTVLMSAPGRQLLDGASWTPDGSGILYSAQDPASGVATLRIVDADGSNDRSATASVTTFGREPRLRPVP